MMNEIFNGFASDNNATVHPRIMQALADANHGHCLSYGDDSFTEEALSLFKQLFGQDSEAFFVFNGTGANVLALQALTQPYHAIICADTAHICVDECGAPARSLIANPTKDGKLTIAHIEPHLHVLGVEHHSQPHAVSISQSTEMGTVYTVDEIREIAAVCHRHGLFLHVDGARIANAAVSLNVSLQEMIVKTGVDILSFGGTKNGMMFGEAVVILNPALAQTFKYIRKQGTQLASKMRFIAAQFIALLTDNLWLQNAQNANRMAQLLSHNAREMGITVTQPTQANSVFAVLPAEAIKKLQQESFFYMWNVANNEVRWVCSWDTTEEDVKQFTASLKFKVSGLKFEVSGLKFKVSSSKPETRNPKLETRNS
ncbi:MAG: low specificity L-threonine aldolase [Bacteroidales bacterium]|jgi:threonine aldolase|nr:low specificity L-threonine aldolase [Bacteroidales bacterium]